MTKKKNAKARKNVKMMGNKEKPDTLKYVEEKLQQDTRVARIFDKITRMFIFSGYPLSVKSRDNVKYEWTDNKRVFKDDIEFCEFVFGFIANEMPEIRKVFNPFHIGYIMLALRETVDAYGHTKNGYKRELLEAEKDFTEPVKIRARRSLSVEEATNEILNRYNIHTVLDGYFLFTNRKTKSREIPIGGIGPILRVAGIIEEELGFIRPDTELIVNVTSSIYEKIKDKGATKEQASNTYTNYEYYGVSEEINSNNMSGLYILGGVNNGGQS